ncbi:MAG: hypothetical protein GY820_03995 [Gammaproteobacteria bacterium]|nr:hypothetical protein [Gammaproteobacteria bacterium]
MSNSRSLGKTCDTLPLIIGSSANKAGPVPIISTRFFGNQDYQRQQGFNSQRPTTPHQPRLSSANQDSSPGHQTQTTPTNDECPSVSSPAPPC